MKTCAMGTQQKRLKKQRSREDTFSSEKYGYFSYFSKKTYIMALIRSASLRH